MISLGLDVRSKEQAIADYVRSHEIAKTFVLSPKKFSICGFGEWEPIDWPEIIKYKFFYRLLQEISPRSLVVVNECLRTQQRSDLTYNCIRHFLAQTDHVLVFQWLPIIDQVDDLMILIDFDTKSRWKGLGFKSVEIDRSRFIVEKRTPMFVPQEVVASNATKEKYAATRAKLFESIDGKDPHTIPRTLHLLTGQEKLPALQTRPAIGRNNRFKIDGMASYKDESIIGQRIVFEFPHSFIDMSDFLSLAGQEEVVALVSNLKVDQWYLQRYLDWSQRIEDAYAKILG